MSLGIFIIWKINSGLYCEKKVWGQLWEIFEAVSMGKKKHIYFFWKYCSVHSKKLHRIKVKKVKKNLGSIFYLGKTIFFRAKNFKVSTKTLWSVLCWLLLWFSCNVIFRVILQCTVLMTFLLLIYLVFFWTKRSLI